MKGLFGEHVQFAAAVIPVQGVAGEQPSVLDVEHHVPRRVTGCGHSDHARFDGDGFGPCEDDGGVRRGVGVGLVDPHLGPEPLGPAVGVCDVVAVGEQYVAQAAEVFDPRSQVPREPRRVDHQVPARPYHQVGVRPERRAGVVAQRVDAGGEFERERRLRRAAGLGGADRLRRAGHGRPPELSLLGGILRLACHEGQPLLVRLDQSGRPMTGGVAADAAGVHEPGTAPARRVRQVRTGHRRSPPPTRGAARGRSQSRLPRPPGGTRSRRQRG